MGLLLKDVELGNAFIDAYAKSGSLIVAKHVFEKLPIHNVVSWNSLLGGYAYHGKIDEFSHSFNRMFFEHMEPDPITFLIVLNVSNCIVHPSECDSFFEHLTKHFGVVPNHGHDMQKIKFLCHKGILDEAMSMIKRMPSLNNVVAWRVLLSSCTYYGNFDMGTHAFEHAVSCTN